MISDPRACTITAVSVTPPHDRDGRHPDVVGDYLCEFPTGARLWFTVYRDDATLLDTGRTITGGLLRACDNCGDLWDVDELYVCEEDGLATCPACEDAEQQLIWDDIYGEMDALAEIIAHDAALDLDDSGYDGVPF